MIARYEGVCVCVWKGVLRARCVVAISGAATRDDDCAKTGFRSVVARGHPFDQLEASDAYARSIAATTV